MWDIPFETDLTLLRIKGIRPMLHERLRELGNTAFFHYVKFLQTAHIT
jgi:hypothetical protein